MRLACACSFVLFVFAPHARAQSVQGTPTPTPARTAPASTEASAAAAQRELSGRERRAQAYAKLLEGQRHYAASRSGSLTVEALRQAQKAFREAMDLDPTLSEAHTALAEIAFFFLDDLEEAEREAAAATRVDKNNLGGHRILSRVYAIKSNFAEEKLDKTFAERAVAALREVLRLRGNDAEAWALLGEFHHALGREQEAIQAFKRWAEAAPPVESRFYQVFTKGRELTPDAAYARLGEVLLRAGRTTEAVEMIRQAMALEPDNPRYLALLGEAFEATGGLDNSILSELGRRVEANPRNSTAVGLLARAQARAGRLDEAVATLRAGVAARKTNDRGWFDLQIQLARTYTDALRQSEAIAVYEDLLKSRRIGEAPLTAERDREFASIVLRSIVALQRQAGEADAAFATIGRMRRLLGNNDATAEVQNIILLRQLGKRREALEAARAARTQYPEDLELLRLETQTLSDLGRVDEAVGIRRARLTGSLEDFNEYAAIATLLMGVGGRGSEAVEAARKALELVQKERPELTNQALVLLSSAQERAGDPKGSEESLRRILAREPNNANALNNLGYFLTERNERLPEALEMIQRAVRAEPTNSSYLDSLGWIYYKLGQLEEAERYLSDAARRNPSSVAIQEHLGDLLERRGKRAEARAAWQKALLLSVEASEIERLKAKLNGTK
jgi:tetratricopeptide (TPR) repeat protein